MNPQQPISIETALDILERESTQMSDMLCAKRVAIDILKQTFAPQFTELEEKRASVIELTTSIQNLTGNVNSLISEKDTLQEQYDVEIKKSDDFVQNINNFFEGIKQNITDQVVLDRITAKQIEITPKEEPIEPPTIDPENPIDEPIIGG